MGKGLWIGIFIVALLLIIGGWALMQGLTPDPAQTPAAGTETSAQNTATEASAVSGSVASDEELYDISAVDIDDSVALSDEAVIDAPQ